MSLIEHTVLSLIQELPLSCQGTLGILTFLIKFIYLAIWAIQGYPRDLSSRFCFRSFRFVYGARCCVCFRCVFVLIVLFGNRCNLTHIGGSGCGVTLGWWRAQEVQDVHPGLEIGAI